MNDLSLMSKNSYLRISVRNDCIFLYIINVSLTEIFVLVTSA